MISSAWQRFENDVAHIHHVARVGQEDSKGHHRTTKAHARKGTAAETPMANQTALETAEGTALRMRAEDELNAIWSRVGTTNRQKCTGRTFERDSHSVWHQDVQVGATDGIRGLYNKGDRELRAGTTVMYGRPIAAVNDTEAELLVESAMRGMSADELGEADIDTHGIVYMLSQALLRRQTTYRTTSVGLNSDCSRAECILQQLLRLHPQSEVDCNLLQSRCPTSTADASISAVLADKIQNAVLALPLHLQTAAALSLHKVLYWKVRSNCMGIHSNSDLLMYNSHYSALSATALYGRPSMFNHSCSPNTSRHSIGSLSIFRTLRVVPVGEQLCISYVESELLPLPPAVRTAHLPLHFNCTCSVCTVQCGHDSSTTTPCRDGDGGESMEGSMPPEAEALLSQMLPHDRIDVLTDYIATSRASAVATGGRRRLSSPVSSARAPCCTNRVAVGSAFSEPNGHIAKDFKQLQSIVKKRTALGGSAHVEPAAHMPCVQHIDQVLKLKQHLALAYQQIGEYGTARKAYLHVLSLIARYLPINDESLICFATQCARCSYYSDKVTEAMQLLMFAMKIHRICFGGGSKLYLRRYRQDITGAFMTGGTAKVVATADPLLFIAKQLLQQQLLTRRSNKAKAVLLQRTAD